MELKSIRTPTMAPAVEDVPGLPTLRLSLTIVYKHDFLLALLCCALLAFYVQVGSRDAETPRQTHHLLRTRSDRLPAAGNVSLETNKVLSG